jgi:hypothetical protein
LITRGYSGDHQEGLGLLNTIFQEIPTIYVEKLKTWLLPVTCVTDCGFRVYFEKIKMCFVHMGVPQIQQTLFGIETHAFGGSPTIPDFKNPVAL